MRVSILSLTLLAAATATATYVIEDDYEASSFASMFDFYTDDDPTNGYVNYISQDDATSSGLYKIENGAVYMGVDNTNTASGRGRDSIRISSKKSYNHGLIILDLAHMPAGVCGTWPAFWLLGPNWPYSGEIDIIEGVNDQNTNNMAMHTDAGCSITNTGAFSGSLETANCDVDAADQASNAGCSIRSGDTTSFGSGFNWNGGGVYATEWTSDAVNIWYFPRSGIPADITAGTPDPTGWGLPQGQFAGGCDIDSKIQNQQLVFDVTFCGDWAGNVWSSDATCASQGSTCQAFVQNNPAAFQDTYWLINSLKVYTDNGGVPSSSSPHTTPTAAPTTSAVAVPTAATTLFTIVSSNILTIDLPPTTTFFSQAAQPTSAAAAVTTAPDVPAIPVVPVDTTPGAAPTVTETVAVPSPWSWHGGGGRWADWKGRGGWGGRWVR
ncbi:endo-1,3(4)-beta-glucanase [Capronia coronata CBS 617.96]|uniref:endo-1,3(4)-beta-glucanase n=1 Tax=Capronia coronata CBS 617.96 TaxID=1182541 RepID=W9YNA1_9EURO|nr:endo-1,3(4)-beta-glucanase [Capronia coronata CBS 617.96]EXJ94023.1 endo-1,3(4)-beta-glucanase [Capronia coronata CBS 617.96]